METVLRNSAPLLFTDTIVASVANKRLTVLPLRQYWVTGIFQISVTQATGVTVFSVRLYGSIDGVNFPAVGTAAEALISTATNLAQATAIMRAPIMLNADGGTVQRPGLIPPFLMCEYTATVATSLTWEMRGLLFGSPPAGIE